MSRLVRHRRCSAFFLPDCFAAMVRFWRLCPRGRGPLPPTGGVPTADDLVALRHAPQVA